MRDRNQFLSTKALAVLMLLLFSASVQPLFAQPALVDPASISDRYIDELPQPAIWGPVFGTPTFSDPYGPGFDMYEKEVQQVVHTGWPATHFFTYDTSPLAGVGATPGPTMVALSNTPLVVRFHNNLPPNALIGVDHTIMGADRGLPDTRTSIHVHGAHVIAADDGHPDSTFNPGTSRDYHYSNLQEAATLWYHDHTMGTTRLNAYQGLAGFWLVVDPTYLGLLGNGLPDLNHLKGIALQDREFTTDYQLWYPNPWVPEFFGRIPMINGKAFPKCTVDPAQYLTLWLGGSQARFWNLTMVECDAEGNPVANPVTPPAWTVVADEQGLLAHPAVVNDPNVPNSPRMMVAPGERFQVVIDFSPYRGKFFKVINNCPTPFGGVIPPDFVSDVPDVMVFAVRDVNPTVTAAVPANLRPVNAPVVGPNTLQRNVSLREYHDLTGYPTRMLVNGMHFYDPMTEMPRLGSTELWSWVNTTMDVHPMHMHDVRFTIYDRRPFDVGVYIATGDIVYTGPVEAPAPYESGWKDIALCPPGYQTRFAATFDDYTGMFMDHCHILDHEENEMMRPFMVMPSDYSDIHFTLTQPVLGCDPSNVARRDTLCVSVARPGLPNLQLIIHLPHGLVLDAASMIVDPVGMPREPHLLHSFVQDLGGDSIELDVSLAAPFTVGDTTYCVADIPLREATLPLGSYTLDNIQTRWVSSSGQNFDNELLLAPATLVDNPPCSFVVGFDARPADAGVWLAWNWTPDPVGAVAMEVWRSPMSGEYPLYPNRLFLDQNQYPNSVYPPVGWVRVLRQVAAPSDAMLDASTFMDNNLRGDMHMHSDMNMSGNMQMYWLDADVGWSDTHPANTFRDVYRYVTFTQDVDGTWSVGAPIVMGPGDGANTGHATNYWLGDFTVDNPGMPGSNGYVDTEDLSILSVNYFHTTPPFAAYCNIGPVVTEHGMVGRGVPTPDNRVNFSDLVPFSFNFGTVSPVGGAMEFMVRPTLHGTKGFAQLDAAPSVRVNRTETAPISTGQEFTVDISLTGNLGNVIKALEAMITFNADALEFVSANLTGLGVTSGSLFTSAQPIDGQAGSVGLAAAACGGDAMLTGEGAVAALTFRWKSSQIDNAEIVVASVKLADNTGAIIDGTGNTLGVHATATLPTEYALHQNFPNPFNPTTDIAFDLKADGYVTLEVFNVLGQRVMNVVNSNMKAGHHVVNLDAHSLTTGVYIYQINVNGFSDHRKMLLMR